MDVSFLVVQCLPARPGLPGQLADVGLEELLGAGGLALLLAVVLVTVPWARHMRRKLVGVEKLTFTATVVERHAALLKVVKIPFGVAVLTGSRCSERSFQL